MITKQKYYSYFPTRVVHQMTDNVKTKFDKHSAFQKNKKKKEEEIIAKRLYSSRTLSFRKIYIIQQ